MNQIPVCDVCGQLMPTGECSGFLGHDAGGYKNVLLGVQVYESDFALVPTRVYGSVTIPRGGLMDVAWILLKLGIDRDSIMVYLKARNEDKPYYRPVVRAVAPGFMNRGMRRAIARAFNYRLQMIYENGSIPVLEHNTRRVSDLRAS